MEQIKILYREKKRNRAIDRRNEIRRYQREYFIAIDRCREWLHCKRVNGREPLFNKLL